MPYLIVSIIGLVGADPEQRQVKSGGAKFTVLFVATQRSWKNAEDEWVSKTEWHRVSIFRPGSPSTPWRRSREARTSWSRAVLLARLTRLPMARAKRRRAQKSRPGLSALTWFASWTESSSRRKRPRQRNRSTRKFCSESLNRGRLPVLRSRSASPPKRSWELQSLPCSVVKINKQDIYLSIYRH